MKKDFLKSVTTGITCLTLLSGCSYGKVTKGTKGSARQAKENNFCGVENGCAASSYDQDLPSSSHYQDNSAVDLD